jgi:hypothetical protein
MEILVRLASLLSPSFFAVLAGLSLTAAALLFVAGKRNAAEPQVTGNKLSKIEPIEYRGAGYLILAFFCSISGLTLSLIFTAIVTGAFWSLILVILSLLCLLFTLCLLCAGGGTLLRAVIGRRGRVARRFYPRMHHIDTLIARFGNLLTAGLPRQSRRPRTIAEIDALAKTAKETPTTTTSDYEQAKLAEAMERLHRKLAKYEAKLTPEQREKLMEERTIVEELRSMYP